MILKYKAAPNKFGFIKSTFTMFTYALSKEIEVRLLYGFINLHTGLKITSDTFTAIGVGAMFCAVVPSARFPYKFHFSS